MKWKVVEKYGEKSNFWGKLKNRARKKENIILLKENKLQA